MAKKAPTHKVESEPREVNEATDWVNGGAYPPERWNLNIFDLVPEEGSGPEVGDWVKVNIGESIVIRDVILVVGAKVYLNSGGFVLAQDVIEIR